MDTLIFIALGFIIFLGAEKATTLNNLRFVAQDVGFDFSNLLSPIVNLSVLVQNPTSGNLTLKSLAGSFSINGTPSGNVSFFPATPSYVAANGVTGITLQLRLSDVALINDVKNFFNNGAGALVININATANVNDVPLPVTLNFSA
jgi:hypothetical protein